MLFKKKGLITYQTYAFSYGGADEARTRYLIVANDALSQVSYSPTNGIINTITPLYISQKVSFCQFFYPVDKRVFLLRKLCYSFSNNLNFINAG